MLRTIGIRLFATIPTVLGVACVVFLVVHLIPGDPAAAALGTSATPQQLEDLRQRLGLNVPLWSQFTEFLGNYGVGNFGFSISSRQTVLSEITSRIGATMTLAFAGMLLSVLLGVPLGIYGAIRRGKLADIMSQIVSAFGIATPPFWLGLLLSFVFAIRLGWFPSIGPGEPGNVVSILRALVLPALALGLPGMALVARMTRSSMLDVLSEDYIRTAQAKGLTERVVLYKHALRNAAIPILTIVGLNFGHLLGGTIVIEIVFARPGLGKLLLDSILFRDYPVVQGVCFVIAIIFVVVNLLTDLLYAYLDPRVSHA